jgi:hypothetical protein
MGDDFDCELNFWDRGFGEGVICVAEFAWMRRKVPLKTFPVEPAPKGWFSKI